MVKAAWSAEEDAKLQALIAQHGPCNWGAISRGVPGRSSKSCRLRWCNQLNPEINREPFTDAEDRAIIEGHRLHGPKWAVIARDIVGRTDNQVKNRFNSTLQRKFPGLKAQAAKMRRQVGARGGGDEDDDDEDDDEDDEAPAPPPPSSGRKRAASALLRGVGGARALERGLGRSHAAALQQQELHGGANGAAGEAPPAGEASDGEGAVGARGRGSGDADHSAGAAATGAGDAAAPGRFRNGAGAVGPISGPELDAADFRPMKKRRGTWQSLSGTTDFTGDGVAYMDAAAEATSNGAGGGEGGMNNASATAVGAAAAPSNDAFPMPSRAVPAGPRGGGGGGEEGGGGASAPHLRGLPPLPNSGSFPNLAVAALQVQATTLGEFMMQQNEPAPAGGRGGRGARGRRPSSPTQLTNISFGADQLSLGGGLVESASGVLGAGNGLEQTDGSTIPLFITDKRRGSIPCQLLTQSHPLNIS
mmetsp:Transcript_22364/g.72567  ORF Transcript_22364/g.72567 Transcript_22364/m.72567 type:complete len:475 (+) Transcript_22364:113-1537(+)|eukprot:CAMPEP_0170133514 /NCGR_PEP_ID=MMETSP0033_2-20121228/1354_1 /TAXON_ID=195969 /ORGANISM="Dolichomastix tenuilepis, Strain CCMP3274" /LENGTH=474 /DNA_ID=CAMNT_0010369009 /DNA_START=109 /DNA_END=1533 /DNA_ORIENTATION=+